jgi:hypothetical protein
MNNYSWIKTFLRGGQAAAFIALTATGAVAMSTADCLSCHGDKAIVQEGGGYLYINPDRYRQLPHGDLACADCHADISDEHPRGNVRPPRANCGNCHERVKTEYAQSVHADNATCTDCHDPHSVEAYGAAAGFDENRTCEKCHNWTDMVEIHSKWLEQTDLHLSTLLCITCHTNSKDYIIIFYIARINRGLSVPLRVRFASLKTLNRYQTSVKTSHLIDLNGDGIISLGELRSFIRRAEQYGLDLWGMMTPAEPNHRMVVLENRKDCVFCHTTGSRYLQTSYVALPDKMGDYRRIPVQKGAALDTVYGTPDFYIIGVTRSKALSIAGIVITACGLIFPVLHGMFRIVTIRKRKRARNEAP